MTKYLVVYFDSNRNIGRVFCEIGELTEEAIKEIEYCIKKDNQCKEALIMNIVKLEE